MEKKIKKPEQIIQEQIVEYLRLKKILFTAIPNELGGSGKIGMLRTVKHKKMGLRSGSPDLILFLKDARIVCIEVKSKKGVQSDSQKEFEKELKELSHEYYIVKSLNELIEVLR